MVDRTSFIVNHRVALSGSGTRAAMSTHRVEYIATRPGAVRMETDVDLRLARQTRELGLAGYLDRRPGAVSAGGTALFDQAGPVALADARRSLASGDGAVLCTVLSVRREDAEALGLTDKESWERLVRREWPQAFASMTGTAESDVRYVAAMHVKDVSLHVHVLSWSGSERPWDSLIDRHRMERARRRLTDAALEPELRRVSAERTLSRDRAVGIVREMDGARLGEGVTLPETGSLGYAHLRRYHPEAAREVRASVARESALSPDATEALRAHERSVGRSADLRGLVGRERDTYVAGARRDLEARMCNAALRSMRPDRADGPIPHERVRTSARDGPSTARRRERALSEELEACVGPRERVRLLGAAADGRPVRMTSLGRCPTLAAGLSRGTGFQRELERALGRAAPGIARALATATRTGGADADEADGREALLLLSHAVLAALDIMTGTQTTSAAITRAVSRGIAI